MRWDKVNRSKDWWIRELAHEAVACLEYSERLLQVREVSQHFSRLRVTIERLKRIDTSGLRRITGGVREEDEYLYQEGREGDVGWNTQRSLHSARLKKDDGKVNWGVEMGGMLNCGICRGDCMSQEKRNYIDVGTWYRLIIEIEAGIEGDYRVAEGIYSGGWYWMCEMSDKECIAMRLCQRGVTRCFGLWDTDSGSDGLFSKGLGSRIREVEVDDYRGDREHELCLLGIDLNSEVVGVENMRVSTRRESDNIVWRLTRFYIGVDGRSHLLSGETAGSDANRIIRDSNRMRELVVEAKAGGMPQEERKEVWNDCKSCKVRVGSKGNLLLGATWLLGKERNVGSLEKVHRFVFKKSEIENLYVMSPIEGAQG
ncbi:hypothetical protein Tco_1361882 [Tanacetum coccineum]